MKIAKNGVEEQKIVSRLIDHLEKGGEKIDWIRTCWKDGKHYSPDNLVSRLDNDFSSTSYFGSLALGEITLEYNIDWEDLSSSFNINFTKWANIGLNPKPKEVTLFSRNPYSEEKETNLRDLPIYQARYHTLFVEYFDEARVALLDFIKNGEKLSKYFRNMRDESVKPYLMLIQRFGSVRDISGIIRMG